MTKGPGTISVGDVRVLGDLHTHQATLTFKVFCSGEGKTSALPGLDVVSQLRRELAADPELLSQPVAVVRTVVCQNTCGGHGTCDQATRRCVCQVINANLTPLLRHPLPACLDGRLGLHPGLGWREEL